tara:strand:+ start:77 stop:862 length:786 start_codon:yes stop_codon:yes gene_type:complete
MAETLTVNDTPEASNELTAEEQDSLQVGEALTKEQGELLAGKYKNAEDLEKAYIELQKKLGDGEPKAEAEETTEETTEEETVDENPALSLINEASEEFYKNDNQLTPETIEKFSQLDSKELISAYLESIKNAPQTQQQEEVDLAQRDIDRIHKAVGGESEYKKLTAWGSKNLSESEISSFDNVISSGDPNVIELAVSGLKAKYENSNGYEGRMLTGKSTSSSEVYRSQAQLVAAMGDPRYDNDPAYRADVIAKLERSDLQF